MSEKTDGAKEENAGNPSSSRRQYVVRQVNKMTPAERVREAIKNGARTQKEIAQGTKLGKDEIGDALANLLLWTREIKTALVDNNRVYLINEPAPELLYRQEKPAPNLENRGDAENLLSRKRDVPSSFSAVQDLMPGEKAEAEPERAPGWVAA